MITNRAHLPSSWEIARATAAIAVILTVTLAAEAQRTANLEVGVDEKLGAQAAIDDVFKDENGNDVTLRRLITRPTILILNYFRCPGVCPILLTGMVDVINRIPLKPGEDFRVVAVSFDPTDTPQAARDKKTNYLNQIRRPFPPEAWHFLTGQPEAIKKLTSSVGYNFSPQKEMFMHPAATIVLTSKGVVSRYLYGTTFLPADVEMAIDEAAVGQVRPTISKVLSFCYSYDPEGRQYVFSITRLAGAVILALAGVFVIVAVIGRAKRKERG